MPSTDVHQHLWPERLIAELVSRRRRPRLRRTGDEWWLEIDGEHPQLFRATAHDPERRAAAARAAGVGRVLVASSQPLGIESLPERDARPLLEAFNDGILELGPPFGLWGAVGTDRIEPDLVDTLLFRGAVGVALPATALSTPADIDRCAPLLERLEDRDAPLFVHPGPAAGGSPAPWWNAMTGYVAQMNAAWHAFQGWGRIAHPRLRVVFAMLAGCAPLHVERLRARGGPSARPDRLTFYDTSSYGADTALAVAGRVGVEQLVHGTDAPVIEPVAAPLGGDLDELVRRHNVERLLGAGSERPVVEYLPGPVRALA